MKLSPKTPLEKAVTKWVNFEYDEVKETIECLLHNGCKTGMVNFLIWEEDTKRFYNKHRLDISRLLVESCDGMSPSDIFGDKWDRLDPLALDTQNQNLLAWFGFEETARVLYERAGGEWQ